METEDISSEIVENTESSTVQDTSINEQLTQIHEDLGVISSIIIFFVVVVLLRYAYKFFDMIFKF